MQLKTPPLCLVGMSGAGKSHWARAMARVGFSHHDCDAAIAHRLAGSLPVDSSLEPVYALGQWMGMPWSDGYKARQAQYLELEAAVTREALTRCVTLPGMHVLDTTGSVVHLDDALLADLRASCHVVALASDAASREHLKERYLRKPKPIVFGAHYQTLAGEDHAQALSRSYDELMAFRQARYRSLAHVVLEAGRIEASRPSLREFLRLCELPGPGVLDDKS
jgi:hypothetical protein